MLNAADIVTAPPERPTYVFEGFHLDAQRRVLSRNGDVIQLPPKVVDTLIRLVEHRGEVLEKRALLNAIWPHVVVEENNLNQAISSLRRVLGERPGEHRFIATEPGRGYRFVATVTTLPGPLTSATSTEHSVADDQTAARGKTVSQRKLLYAATVLLVVALGAGLGFFVQDSDVALPNSIAVLPFTTLSADPEAVDFAAGLHAEMLRQLTKVSSLNVIALPSVLRYASTDKSFPEIAAELRAQTLLSADVRYADGDVRVTLRLVDGATGKVIWNPEPFDAVFEKIFALESEIATAIADELSAELLPSERASIETAQTVSPEAYRYYLRAQAVLHGARSSDLIVEYLDEALNHDPEFAEAHALKAFYYSGLLISQFGFGATAEKRGEYESRARESADDALELDEYNWTAHSALAEMDMYSWRWTDARERYELAARAVPKVPHAPFYALIAATEKDEFEDAIREQRRVIVLDPQASNEHWVLGLLHAYSGDLTSAVGKFNEAIYLDPGFALWRVWLAHAEGMAGNAPAALVELERAEGLPSAHASPLSIANLAYAYARNGRADKARQLVNLLETQAVDKQFEAGNWALAYLAVGDEERALQSLRTVVDKIAREEPDGGFFTLRLIRLNLYNDEVLNKPSFADLRARLHGR